MSIPEHHHPHNQADLLLTNTMSRRKEVFTPISPDGKVGLYTCGITAYSRAHIGNLRAYLFADTLKRSLWYHDYDVKHVMNVTDVGHLTSDADEGEDKMAKSARKERMTAWEVSEKYTKIFLEDCAKLNIEPSDVLCKATEYIVQQIDLVLELEKKGFTYVIDDGVYFDTSRLKDYGKLARLDIEGLSAGQRVEMGGKKNKTDFALWKFSPPGEQRDMEWPSPWGLGFPGWHIECSAMSMEHLGDQFDIHTGGIDHIPVHHTNEIAQSEAASGKSPFVRYWMHSEFLTAPAADGSSSESGVKMSKSLGNIVDIDTLNEQGIKPLVFRYFVLGAKYSRQLQLSPNAFEGAVQSYNAMGNRVATLRDNQDATPSVDMNLRPDAMRYLAEFRKAIGDDLNTPVGLAVLSAMLKDGDVSDKEKLVLMQDFDSVLGLSLLGFSREEKTQEAIPEDIQAMADERQRLKRMKDWKGADALRDQLQARGYQITDTPAGSEITKI